jgi:Tfp pilus assembly protein PilF
MTGRSPLIRIIRIGTRQFRDRSSRGAGGVRWARIPPQPGQRPARKRRLGGLAGQVDDGRRQVTKADGLAIRPGSGEALYYKDRHFDDAEQEYRTYLERNPQDAAALVGLGRNFFQRGDLDTSTGYFEAALKVDPRQPDALKELGQIDLRQGRFLQACDRLKLLTEIQPYEYDVRYAFAQALKLAGDQSRSRIEDAHAARLREEQEHILKLRTSLRSHPDNPAIRFEVAKWMIENGHVQEGLNWTSEILRAEPRHGPTHRLLADYYQKQGKPGQANYHRLMATTEPDGGTSTNAHPEGQGKPK